MKKIQAVIFAVLLSVTVSSLTGCASAAGKFNKATTIPLKYTQGEHKTGKVYRIMLTDAERRKHLVDYDQVMPVEYKKYPMATIMLHNFAFLIYTTTTAIIPGGMTVHEGDQVEIEMGHPLPDYIPARIVRVIPSDANQ